MLFICTFDAIFGLAPIVWELFGHFVNSAWHIATDCGPEDHAFTDMEFMRHHGRSCALSFVVGFSIIYSRRQQRRHCWLRDPRLGRPAASKGVIVGSATHGWV